jgi:nucleoid DNA-binding protein
MEKQKTLGILVIWMDTINQDLKKQKNASFFGFWDFSMQKPNHKWWKTKKHIEYFFEILIDRIHSNNQKKTSFFLLFHLRKKHRERNKKHLLSQNQTFYHFFV